MISEKEIEKICNKQIQSHQPYMSYAMQDFIAELDTVKSSIVNTIIQDIMRKDPEVKRKDIEGKIREMVEGKIPITIKISFEE
jgi:hypothetical protein